MNDTSHRRLGIHSLRAHFIDLEKHILGKLPGTATELEFGPEILEAEKTLQQRSCLRCPGRAAQPGLREGKSAPARSKRRYFPERGAAQSRPLQHQGHLRRAAGERATGLQQGTPAVRAGDLLPFGLLERRQG